MTLIHHTSKDPGLSREYAATHETTSMSVRWINFIRVQIVGSKYLAMYFLYDDQLCGSFPNNPFSLRLEDSPNPLSILWLLLVRLPSGESQTEFSDTAKQSIHPYDFGFQKFGESIRGTSIKLVATEVYSFTLIWYVPVRLVKTSWHPTGVCSKCSFARECSSGYWWMPLFSLVWVFIPDILSWGSKPTFSQGSIRAFGGLVPFLSPAIAGRTSVRSLHQAPSHKALRLNLIPLGLPLRGNNRRTSDLRRGSRGSRRSSFGWISIATQSKPP
ncbi:hypothetical protein I7I51_03506 [Histoplasma capsulatum]|uniref:Uncharacterized protein n=1 Tax=Ajellomyces capsulatus TaxID=5037 RepID=A0A8A1M9C2_AJECA|nr:hypothetical protein I7I51_03506 [Histoplasma capsulatum]